MRSRMFDLVKATWNPVKGCKHNCLYCWARIMANKLRDSKRTEKYRDGFKPRFFPSELKRVRKFKNKLVFVVDMGDLFGEWVPNEWIEKVLEATRKADPSNTFLFMTKNPWRYHEFIDLFPPNSILGTTIESDLDYGISKAPGVLERYHAMRLLPWDTKLLAIEPILDFSEEFINLILSIPSLKIIYVGYDNYNFRLPEPPLAKTMELILLLKGFGYDVREKTIRPAWDEGHHQGDTGATSGK